MSHPQYETFHKTSNTGITFSFVTAPGGYHPLHWHQELELLFPLNGASDITVDRKKYHLLKKHLMVVESRQVHSTYCYDATSMFFCAHLSREHLLNFMPDLKTYRVHCIPEEIPDEYFSAYLDICQQLEELTRRYMEEPTAFTLEAEGILLQVFAKLLRYFSIPDSSQAAEVDLFTKERVRTVITFVSEHFREPISLGDAAGLLGLGNEYFCRFFKKHMGLSFLSYVNEVRASHVYRDLVSTDLPVSRIMEQNGFTNQKLFNRCFREIYGCTPSSVRKTHRLESAPPAAENL